MSKIYYNYEIRMCILIYIRSSVHFRNKILLYAVLCIMCMLNKHKNRS